MVDRCHPEDGLSAMQRCTGFPAAAAAVLLGTRALPGGGVGSAAEVMPAEPFLARLAERGIAAQERWEAAEPA